MFLRRTQSSQQNDRNMARIKIRFQLLSYLKSRHSRHQNITDNQIGIIRTCLLKSGCTVSSNFYFEIGSDFLFQEFTNIIVIFNNQDFPFIQRNSQFFRVRKFFRELQQMMRMSVRLFQQYIARDKEVFLRIHRLIRRNTYGKYRTTAFIILILNRSFMYLN